MDRQTKQYLFTCWPVFCVSGGKWEIQEPTKCKRKALHLEVLAVQTMSKEADEDPPHSKEEV
eukprot:scaffold8419_cov62-Attheya_sp.AAC.8